MVNRQELMSMLIEALSFEEITVTSGISTLLRKLAQSGLDDATKAEATTIANHMLDETMEHSRTLSKILKMVAGGDRDEY